MDPQLFRVVRYGLVLASFALSAWSTSALGQQHAVRHADLEMHSTVVNSQSISAETAREHGIAPAHNVGVLNVVVLREIDGVQWPIRAAVSATRTTLSGVQRDIDLRPVEAEGRVSYLGSFEFVPREVLDFKVTARINPASPLLQLSYRERMPPTQLPSPTR
jgi:hypothetical protein